MGKCDCGSGQEREAEHDARGIFLCYACGACRARRLSGYRREVLTDPSYACDEDVEGDFFDEGEAMREFDRSRMPDDLDMEDGIHPEDPDFAYDE